MDLYSALVSQAIHLGPAPTSRTHPQEVYRPPKKPTLYDWTLWALQLAENVAWPLVIWLRVYDSVIPLHGSKAALSLASAAVLGYALLMFLARISILKAKSPSDILWTVLSMVSRQLSFTLPDGGAGLWTWVAYNTLRDGFEEEGWAYRRPLSSNIPHPHTFSRGDMDVFVNVEWVKQSEVRVRLLVLTRDGSPLPPEPPYAAYETVSPVMKTNQLKDWVKSTCQPLPQAPTHNTLATDA